MLGHRVGVKDQRCFQYFSSFGYLVFDQEDLPRGHRYLVLLVFKVVCGSEMGVQVLAALNSVDPIYRSDVENNKLCLQHVFAPLLFCKMFWKTPEVGNIIIIFLLPKADGNAFIRVIRVIRVIKLASIYSSNGF